MRFLIIELHHKSNEDILEELKIKPIPKCVQNYQSNWRLHVRQMERNRIPKEIIAYKPRAKTHLGRPLKRWHNWPHGPIHDNRLTDSKV
jgi:hypothetical protein